MGTRLFSLLALISLAAPSPLLAQAKKKPAPPEVSQADHDKLVERAKALRGLVKGTATNTESPLANAPAGHRDLRQGALDGRRGIASTRSPTRSRS